MSYMLVIIAIVGAALLVFTGLGLTGGIYLEKEQNVTGSYTDIASKMAFFSQKCWDRYGKGEEKVSNDCFILHLNITSGSVGKADVDNILENSVSPGGLRQVSLQEQLEGAVTVKIAYDGFNSAVAIRKI